MKRPQWKVRLDEVLRSFEDNVLGFGGLWRERAFLVISGVSMALIASIYVGEYDAAGIVAFIMQIGGYLEQATVRRARSGLERLVALTPRTARVVGIDGMERVIDAKEVPQDALLRVWAASAFWWAMRA